MTVTARKQRRFASWRAGRGANCARWAICVAAILFSSFGRADIFILQDDGQVRGELVNPKQNPRISYVVRTPAGGTITLAKEQVKKIASESTTEKEYVQIRSDFPDTVEGQWQLAEWCREHSLTRQRKTHLERVIAIEPDHAEARRALGYRRVQGKWLTQQEENEAKGLVRYKGQWVLKQQVEILEQDRRNELVQKEWFRRIKTWRKWLDGDRHDLAIEQFQQISNPNAVRALAHYLHDEDDQEVRLLYVRTLAGIEANDALDALASAAMDDEDEEVRIACVEELAHRKYKPAVNYFVRRMKSSKENVYVNRAAVGLGALKDAAATGPLIDALITKHKVVVHPGGNPGQMSASFGNGGAGAGAPGFGFGQPKAQVFVQSMKNADVLTALVKITGKNFDYDTQAWKAWFAQQRRPKDLDLRRDG